MLVDSEEKLCKVCKRRKLRVNVGKSKVMRCSRYGNGGRMLVILNREPLQEVDCFSTLMGWAVNKASVPIRLGHFHPNVNVYAISNFLPLSFVLDNFF